MKAARAAGRAEVGVAGVAAAGAWADRRAGVMEDAEGGLELGVGTPELGGKWGEAERGWGRRSGL